MGLHPSIYFGEKKPKDKSKMYDLMIKRKDIFQNPKVVSYSGLTAFKIDREFGRNQLTGEAGSIVKITNIDIWSFQI